LKRFYFGWDLKLFDKGVAMYFTGIRTGGTLLFRITKGKTLVARLQGKF
jgi:hypothetical protein